MNLKDILFVNVIKHYYQLLLVNNYQKKKILNVFIVIGLMSLSWLIGYKYRDAKILIQEYYISSLHEKQITLSKDVSQLENNLEEYKFMLKDGDYYRYLSFKHADIFIPKGINANHLKLMTEHAIINKIPLKYFYRLVNKESRFNYKAASNKGAQGYMQVIPSTMKMMCDRYEDKQLLESLNDTEKNIVIGSYFLGYLYKKYNRWDLTFAAYNAGSVVDKCHCVPNYKETQNYVNYIMKDDK